VKFVTLITAFLGFLIPVSGQDIFKFRPTEDLPVSGANATLALAWSGGLNSAQYGTIDLNEDGLDDLTIFDRTTNKINTYISNGSTYRYSPQYEYLFPKNINSWMLLADYNCDGKKDIFTNTTFGLKVYKNTTDGQLSFELQEDPLLTEIGGSMVNLQVGSSDLPALSDIDGDGDLDILVFNFSAGSSVEYHQNQSMENDGSCNHLIFKRMTSSWGNFQECGCGEYVFGQTCSELGGRWQHAGGKSLLTFDQDGDGDQELIFGDEFCTNIAYMHNQGDPDNAVFIEAVINYPNSSTPIDFFIFPGMFFEDLNFDGRKDLLASPNVFDNLDQMIDFKHSSHFYPNDGVTGSEFFTFQNNDFLQDQMIELGEGTVPVFLDVDGDGDQDMVLGHKGNREGGLISASFHLYLNNGISSQPSFELSSENYLGLSGLLLQSLKPSYGDLDGDRRIDFLFSAADASGQTRIYYFLNNSNTGFTPVTSLPQVLAFEIQAGDHPYFEDLNFDGQADLLLGRRAGRLEYWLNTSGGGNFTFNLVDESVAGIVDDSFRRELAPMAADINRDGELELVTIDATGVMRVYRNFLSSDDNNPVQLFELVIEPAENEPMVRSRWGRGASIANASLGSQLPHLIIGSKQGGLFLLENLSAPGGGSGGPDFTLEVFPNPGVEMVTIHGNQKFMVEIYNNLGQLVLRNQAAPEQTLIRLDSRILLPGIYLVNGISVSGATQVKKLIVVH